MSKFTSTMILFLLLISGVSIAIADTDTQDDMDTGGDAAGSFADAPSIVLIEGTLVDSGYLETDDADDIFALSVGFHKEVYVVMTPTQGSDYDLYMYTQYEWSRPEYSSENTGSDPETILYNSAGGILGAESETVWVKVSRRSGSGNYELSIVVTETVIQNDMDSGGDAGNEIDDAFEIEEGTGEGYEVSFDRYDFYKIPVVEGDNIDVFLASEMAYFNLHLYDTNHVQVDVQSFRLSDDSPAWAHWEARASGFFYIEVRLMQSNGYYSLTVESTPANIAPEADFEITIVGDSILISDQSIDWDGEVVEYLWFWDGEVLEEYLMNSSFLLEDIPVGVHNITLVAADNMGVDSAPFTIIAEIEEAPNQPPEATFSWRLEEGTLIVDASRSSDDDGEIIDYTWYINDVENESFGGSMSWEWEDIESGSYGITLKVLDDDDVEDSYRATVEIEPEEDPDDDDNGVGGIPGFPILSVLPGVLLGILLLRRLGSAMTGIIKPLS